LLVTLMALLTTDIGGWGLGLEAVGTPSRMVLVSWVRSALGSGGVGMGGAHRVVMDWEGGGFIQDMTGRLHMVGGSVYRK
jgi:hypothetical protein